MYGVIFRFGEEIKSSASMVCKYLLRSKGKVPRYLRGTYINSVWREGAGIHNTPNLPHLISDLFPFVACSSPNLPPEVFRGGGRGHLPTRHTRSGQKSPTTLRSVVEH